MPKANLPHIKTVFRNGRPYEYFNTGQRENGRPIYIRLPDKRDPAFGSAYATALANRSRRKAVASLPTMALCAHAYMDSPRYRNRAESTQTTYLIYLRKILTAMGPAPLIGIERQDVRALLVQHAATPAAAQMLLNVFRQLMRFAQSMDWITTDVSLGMEIDHEATPYEPWPEPLLKTALDDADIGLAVHLLYYTDQRLSDVCRMHWAHIQADAIEVKQKKTRKPLTIPLHSHLKARLAIEARGLTTILKDRNGRQRTPDAVGVQIKKWLVARGHPDMNPHGLRKNGVNALLEAGCTVAETAAISGQSLAMVEHYAAKRDNRKLAQTAMAKWDKQ
jgi:integrase